VAITYEPLATITLDSAAASVSFTGISSAYTDLKIIAVGKRVSGGVFAIQFNGDTATNYSKTRLVGLGASGAASTRDTSQTSIGTNGWNTTYNQLYEIDVFSYAGSTNKTCLLAMSADENGGGEVSRIVGLWRNTAAINRVDLLITSGTIAAGFTANLYGILKAT
jgi:hypothetical protein